MKSHRSAAVDSCTFSDRAWRKLAVLKKCFLCFLLLYNCEILTHDGAPRKKTEGVDLCSCSSVEYQERDSVPGVTYTDKSGTCGWTEVRGRRSRRRTVGNLPSSRPSSASEQSESDSEDFVRPPSSTVKFVAVDGQPDLHVSSPRIRSWTPIATRTRSRIKPI